MLATDTTLDGSANYECFGLSSADVDWSAGTASA